MNYEAIIDELTESLLRVRQENYHLTRRMETFDRLEVIARVVREELPQVRQTLASITWADSLEEAHELAQAELNRVKLTD